MFCNQCGKEMPNEALFCPGCGAKREVIPNEAPVVNTETVAETPVQPVVPVQETPVMAQPAAPVQPAAPEQPVQAQPVAGAVPPAAPAKKSGGFPFKIMIPVAIAFVLLAVILVAVLLGGKGSKYDTYAEKELMYNYEEDVFYVFGDEDTTFEIEEDEMYSVFYSADQSRAAYLSYEEGDDSKMLYCIDNKNLEAKLIAEDVYFCKMSYDGEYIAYLQDVKDGKEGDLYIYCVKSGDITQIDSDVYPGTMALSSNGKWIAYVKDYESYDENTLCLGGVGRESVEIDDDGCTPISVTDNGKYLYYVNANYKLYLYNGKESEKIASDVNYDFCVNKDATEILYIKGDKTYYHTVKADDTVKVMSDSLYDVILPEDTVYYNNGGAYMLGLETFKGAVLQGQYEIFWFNNKGTDSETICYYAYDDSFAGKVSEDGKSFVYVSSGNLFKIDKLSEDMEETLLYTDVYVEAMVASDDLSKIYVAGDDELYYIKNADKAIEITNDLSEYEYGGYALAYNEKMGKVFFIEDDTLCYAGTNEKSVEEVEDDVYNVYEKDEGVIFVIDDDGDYIYYFMNSKEPVELELY